MISPESGVVNTQNDSERIIGSRTFLRVSLLLGISALVAFLASWFHPQREAVWAGVIPSLEIIQATQMNPLWIDARSQADYEQSHIPGAIPLSDKNWEEGFSRVVPMVRSDTVIIVYCSSQSCHSSEEAATRLKRELGIKSVYTLKGGFEAWQTNQNKP